MPSTFNLFVAYGTNIVGLERLLRGLQSLLVIITASPLLLTHFANLLTPVLLSTPTPVTLLPALATLASRINVTRRTLRTFRFLEWFAAGLSLFSTSPGSLNLEGWCSIVKWTSLGMYGLLETATLVDVLEIEGLQVFEEGRMREMNRQAQIWWFFALLAGVVGAFSRMLSLSALRPVEGVEVMAIDEKTKGSAKAEAEKVKQEKDLKTKVRREEMKGLRVQVLSDVMDMVLPAAVVGWADVDAAVLGGIMLITTVITGRGVWNKMRVETAQDGAREALAAGKAE